MSPEVIRAFIFGQAMTRNDGGSSDRGDPGDPDMEINDPILPSVIRHNVDEIYVRGELKERYNFIVYEFEQDACFCWARAYLDQIYEVSLYGPFAARNDRRSVHAPEFRDSVVEYLKRRFDEIYELDPSDRATGYSRMWKRSR